MVDPDRPHMTIWRMRVACCITNVINTHSEYVILTAFPLQQWLPERASMLHVQCLSYLYTVSVIESWQGPFPDRL